MKLSHVAVLLGVLSATAAIVVPRTANTQPLPTTPIAPVAPIAPIAARLPTVTARQVAPIALKTQIQTLTDLNGQMVGAGPNIVALIGEDGSATKTFPTNIARPAISPHGTSAILLGDLKAKTLFTMDAKTGAVQPLLKLAEVKDPAQGKVPGGHLLGDGAMSGVASDGKNVFVAVEAGFSSAIFKIDPVTKQVIERAWASAPDPQAMVVQNGALFVLVDNGSRVRRFTDTLERSKVSIDLPTTGARGIGIRAGEIRILGANQIVRTAVDATELSRATISVNTDKLTPVPARLRPVKIPTMVNLVRRVAVLITGDLAENFSGECFWNDTVWMYKTLLANGYKEEDIFVLYGDGADFISANPFYKHPTTVTDMAATPANVNAIFDGLANGDAMRGIPKMDGNDTLFVWTFDHGGREGGEATLCLRGGTLKASAIAAKMNAITYGQRAVFMQQCFSGGFIDPLKNAKTFISTAARADEVARPTDTENEMVGGKTYNHGEFNYHVTTALSRLTPGGAVINADSSSDGAISAMEMHQWNVSKESRAETPQANDMGEMGANFKFKK